MGVGGARVWAGQGAGHGAGHWGGLSSVRFVQRLGAGTELQSLPVHRVSSQQTPQNKNKRSPHRRL